MHCTRRRGPWGSMTRMLDYELYFAIPPEQVQEGDYIEFDCAKLKKTGTGPRLRRVKRLMPRKKVVHFEPSTYPIFRKYHLPLKDITRGWRRL